ncbi:MAG TPA: DUF2382 domain-containing protein [Thermomicrobiales bacterium]|jgi:uncharacterized protein (TIGR02271 family)
MDRTVQQWQIPEGTDVVGADGDKVGKVIAAEPSYIVVEKGFFFPTDYYIPMSAISNFDGDKVYLSVTKDQALNQGWDQQLSSTDYDASTRTYATGAGMTTPVTAEGDRLAGVTPTGLADEVDAGATDATLRDQATDAGQMQGTKTMRVPVHEEELTATKRPVEAGTVRVNKDVVAEERTMDVPVTEEHLVVNRRVVDRDAPADASAFKEDTIEVPLMAEEVDVQKRNRVVEEVEIGKEAVQKTQRVADTVRREEVHVDDSAAGTSTEATS